MITLTIRGSCHASTWRTLRQRRVEYDGDAAALLGSRGASLGVVITEWLDGEPGAVRSHDIVPFVLTVGLDEARWSLTFGEGLPKCPTCGEVARAGDTWCSEACEPRCELCGAVADHATPSDCADHAAMAADIDMKESAT